MSAFVHAFALHYMVLRDRKATAAPSLPPERTTTPPEVPTDKRAAARNKIKKTFQRKASTYSSIA